ncbi:BQ2448_4497 [Microbotryum intermedium]|uniref:BQ2448_4497 protein n=1 Tax=Microbotryum intermedium TaxID=269621 RepID=A0A238FIH1_9BASI|nr:BQ2448_4497 [Microbotryum intermedium]
MVADEHPNGDEPATNQPEQHEQQEAVEGTIDTEDHDDKPPAQGNNTSSPAVTKIKTGHNRNKSTASSHKGSAGGINDENATLAALALAAASSSSLPISPSSDNLHHGIDNGSASPTAQDHIDESSPSFMLVASLRAQITDLKSQVTSLNSKLVTSYTRHGDLEDELHDFKARDAVTQKRLQELEQNNKRWEREIEGGGWVERDHVQGEMQRLMTQVLAETASRETAVQAHSALETEIESLTSTLFDEANKMVVHERIARAKAEEKMVSFDEQTQAMQGVIDGVQTNLRETVTRLEDKEAEVKMLRKKLADAGISVEETEGSPTMAEAVEGSELAVIVSDGVSFRPLVGSGTPTALTSTRTPKLDLVSPRLLNSVQPFHEFLAFVTYLRQLRVSVLSKPLDSPSYSHSLATRSFSTGASIHTPTNSAGSLPSTNPSQLLAPHLPLSAHLSQPFLKRCIEEDSDPSLRLDLAPGLGFLSRRNVAQAIYDGQLVIEPLSFGATLPSANCALCGIALERWSAGASVAKPTILPSNAASVGASVNSTMRKVWGSGSWITGGGSSTSSSGTATPPHQTESISASTTKDYTLPQPTTLDGRRLHVHVFRVNDSSTSKYALCPLYCLGRLRAVCEFWTYVRALERGLLVEEGFKFVRGRGSSILDTSTSSANLPEKVNIAVEAEEGKGEEKGEETMEGLGLTEVETGPAVKEAKDETEASKDTEATKDGEVVKGSEPNKEEGAAEEDDKDDEFVDTNESEEAETNTDGESKEAKSEEKRIEEGSESKGDTESTKSASPVLTKPPLPKRSAARSPVLTSASPLSDRPMSPVPRDSPQAFHSQSLPPPLPLPRRAAGPPPRHPSTAPRLITTVEDVLASAPGWEDVCWSEVVRLKEAVFWTRMAAFGRKGEALEPRKVEVGSIET